MAYLLHIETSTEICSVAISNDAQILALRESKSEKAHATTLTIFIDELFTECSIKPDELAAVSVSEGPGSYTGLRIGVSVAKGICYRLSIPLIAVNTLQAMALSASALHKKESNEVPLFCPMIDARRMEVYTALYDHLNQEVQKINAHIIDIQSFAKELANQTVYFIGGGASKAKALITHRNAIFPDDILPSAQHMIPLAYSKFASKHFVDTAYFEPYYLKDFVATVSKNKIF